MRIPKWSAAAFLIVSFIGFLDALYLTIAHYVGLFLGCFLNGCEEILSSPYATIAGAPVALFGTVYYLAIFVSVIAYLDSKKEWFMNFAAGFTAVGLLASLCLLFVQIFIIKEICFFCLVSAAASIILFVCGLNVFLAQQKNYS